MTPARYSVTRHNPSWQSQIPLEDTKPERRFRRILEDLKISFHSQQEDDYTAGILIFRILGPHHRNQRQMEKDAWKKQQLESLGFRVIDFTDEKFCVILSSFQPSFKPTGPCRSSAGDDAIE